MGEVDNVVPKDKWEFDEDVAECFEDMLTRSIPQYDVMRSSVASMAKSVISNTGKHTVLMLDVGCSDGLMIQKLKDTMKDTTSECKFVGCDVSEPMLKKAKLRFLDDILSRDVYIEECDLRNDFPEGCFDIITSVLSIQFTPIEYRQSILRNIYEHLAPKNGCFIMVEKVLGNTAFINDLLVENYYNMKAENGYSQEQIERKRLSLEGVLVPVTNDWNIDLLRQAGFRQIDVFWRWMNFVGYIAIK